MREKGGLAGEKVRFGAVHEDKENLGDCEGQMRGNGGLGGK